MRAVCQRVKNATLFVDGKEISKIESTKSEMIAELSGFIRNNGNINNNIISLTTENVFLVTRIKKIIKDLYKIDIKEKIIENLNFSKKDLYLLNIDCNDNYILQPPSILKLKMLWVLWLK